MQQVEHAEVFAFECQPKLAVQSFQFDVADDQVSLAGSAVGDDGALHVWKNSLHVRFVEAENRGAVEGDPVHELNEGALNVGERSVLIEMLPVDGGNDGYNRREHQEAAIALVGFHDEVFALAEPRGGARLIYAATNH